MTDRLLSLDHLTVFELTPPELVRVAADSGYTHVGLRLRPAAPPGEIQHPIVGDTPMRRKTRSALRETGVVVFDWGVVRLVPGTLVADLEPWLDTAAELGACNALVNGDGCDDATLTGMFAQLCELGESYGMCFHLEPTPWTRVNTLARAVALVRAADQPNGKVMVDTLHVDRAGASAVDISAVPDDLIVYAQICDGVIPRPTDFETMISQARGERAFPGEGGIDLVSMLKALPVNCPLSLECPTRFPGRSFSAQERASRGLASVNALLGQL